MNECSIYHSVRLCKENETFKRVVNIVKQRYKIRTTRSTLFFAVVCNKPILEMQKILTFKNKDHPSCVIVYTISISMWNWTQVI